VTRPATLEPRALVLFSGGQDSTACLAWALERYAHVETIGFDYGQRHAVELECRAAVRARLHAVPAVAAQARRRPPARPRAARPDLRHRADRRARDRDERAAACRTPSCRGATCCSSTFAAAVAYRRGLNVLVGGMCETDFLRLPDCRDNTLKALQVAISLGMDTPMTIETPLMWLDKAQTWALADELGGEPLVQLSSSTPTPATSANARSATTGATAAACARPATCAAKGYEGWLTAR
jgi:7-cyano-7-deazaguanine synthase